MIRLYGDRRPVFGSVLIIQIIVPEAIIETHDNTDRAIVASLIVDTLTEDMTFYAKLYGWEYMMVTTVFRVLDIHKLTEK